MDVPVKKVPAFAEEEEEVIEIHPEFVVDEHQNRKAVLLPYPEWQKVVQEMEELDDIRAYEEAKRCPSDPMPFDVAVKEIREGHVS